MIDTHAHVMDKQFDADREQVLRRYWDAGGEVLLNIGATIPESEKNIVLARTDKRIFATVGLHPHEALTVHDTDFKKLEQFAVRGGVVAIGECGLDYFWRGEIKDNPRMIKKAKEAQHQLFESQLALASANDLPVVVHARAAHDAIAALLKQHLEKGGLKKRGVIHCFTGTQEEAQTYLQLGFFISFTGIITFGDVKLEEVVRAVALKKICIETDCPYLAPAPHRGKRNEPAHVLTVAKKIAELKNIALDQVVEQTANNAREIFLFSDHQKPHR
ncbi:MAG: hydrolase TatD [Parcubacteria group bacterium CG08_land_8_20_14_0_20_48_21]|nr:MAG: hypothetical protein AUK21_02465 [Parcubacteria group bacterium CG2_30_48_51]PIS32487.1 MAG: hydrolase TatD [Parcubacteria group bacterium CG08_land_8_20_14_0_20_48_21]PIW78835.1 MAG: hydrolase TatD [Parcubacteria group bacterium CG_4_8_14_3_um_filter_48_16]PIY78008.1 MAG: hydrolase TatD [Parcubacteria group bacterium CG_4_10_14_0_8_um_filter_48_154]PIZ77125.1 MAG: hydrolase TatD [bacterium CG_4_10_14_0_2_um_filter_48_144]PJC39786.1 MAG: hydrolase TatD [Parcubacteria group bacterium CG